jgi:hypothetical protein
VTSEEFEKVLADTETEMEEIRKLVKEALGKKERPPPELTARLNAMEKKIKAAYEAWRYPN